MSHIFLLDTFLRGKQDQHWAYFERVKVPIVWPCWSTRLVSMFTINSKIIYNCSIIQGQPKSLNYQVGEPFNIINQANTLYYSDVVVMFLAMNKQNASSMLGT